MNFFSTIRQYLVFIVCYLLRVSVEAYDKEMTVHIDAGKKECFYHHVNKGETIDIEYQVIDGGNGDLDISFSLNDPIGLIIVGDFKKSENIHRHEVQLDGDYRFCFDNTFSAFNRKTVFFELIVEREGEQNLGDNQWNDMLEGLTPEEYYEMKVQDIMDYIGRIRMQMSKARQIQDILRSHEARDRNLAEANFMKVNVRSFIQICAMIAVGLLQVFLVRSIFDNNGRMNKILQKVRL
uniref:GOLD domain-containing protein n=1 Tax=Glossina palpalis gambiensis TaxID=67801 RepID=A0A3F2Z4M5_9MUSC